MRKNFIHPRAAVACQHRRWGQFSKYSGRVSTPLCAIRVNASEYPAQAAKEHVRADRRENLRRTSILREREQREQRFKCFLRPFECGKDSSCNQPELARLRRDEICN